jgi:hypothetical protein
LDSAARDERTSRPPLATPLLLEPKTKNIEAGWRKENILTQPRSNDEYKLNNTPLIKTNTIKVNKILWGH